MRARILLVLPIAALIASCTGNKEIPSDGGIVGVIAPVVLTQSLVDAAKLVESSRGYDTLAPMPGELPAGKTFDPALQLWKEFAEHGPDEGELVFYRRDYPDSACGAITYAPGRGGIESAGNVEFQSYILYVTRTRTPVDGGHRDKVDSQFDWEGGDPSEPRLDRYGSDIVTDATQSDRTVTIHPLTGPDVKYRKIVKAGALSYLLCKSGDLMLEAQVDPDGSPDVLSGTIKNGGGKILALALKRKTEDHWKFTWITDEATTAPEL